MLGRISAEAREANAITQHTSAGQLLSFQVTSYSSSYSDVFSSVFIVREFSQFEGPDVSKVNIADS